MIVFIWFVMRRCKASLSGAIEKEKAKESFDFLRAILIQSTRVKTEETLLPSSFERVSLLLKCVQQN